MASTSAANQSPKAEAAPSYFPYPNPLAKYEDVVISSKLFMETLEKLHATMGTKFMIPIIGGKDLNLHRLFVEVTSRGGILKIIREKRWKEVTAVFNFPSTATNASFVLRKYYMSLLYHYEQIYFFKAKGWCPCPDPFQSLSSPPIPSKQSADQTLPSPEIQAKRMKAAEFSPGATSAPPTSSPVIGVIDGKFESGYLVTVTIGSETLKGVLYQTQQNPAHQVPQNQSVPATNIIDINTPSTSGVVRRRRRKKSEMKKRDPAHPKPNRSGYNFFFAEQHARLKPLYPGKDREISRMIGELWTKMNETERVAYQDIAMKDKERYKLEMQDYRERLRTGQIVSNAVPIQQRPLDLDVNVVETSEKTETEGGESFQTPENEIDSSKSEKSDDSEDKMENKESEDMEISSGVEVGVENMKNENLLGEESLELEKRESSGGVIMMEMKKGPTPCEEGRELLPCEERECVEEIDLVSSKAKPSVHTEGH